MSIFWIRQAQTKPVLASNLILFDTKENSSHHQSEEYCDHNLEEIKQGRDMWQMDKIR